MPFPQIKNPFVRAALEYHESGAPHPGFNPAQAQLDRLNDMIDRLIAGNGLNVVNMDRAIHEVWQAAATCPPINYLQTSGWGGLFELYKIPEPYAHIRQALVNFAILDGTWSPSAADVARIVTKLAENPRGAAVIDAVYLQTLFDLATDAVANTPPAVQANTTPIAMAAPAHARQADINPVIQAADATQHRIQALQASNPILNANAHIREALIAYAVADATWQPSAVDVGNIAANIAIHPRAAGAIDTAYLRTLYDLAVNGPAATLDPTAMAAQEPQKFALATAVAKAHATQQRIQALQGPNEILNANPHLRDALIAYAVADGTWRPSAADVQRMAAEIVTNPPTAVNANYIKQLVDKATDAKSNNAPAVAATQEPISMGAPGKVMFDAAIATANRIETRIKGLRAIPNQYAHVRNALMAYAAQDSQWEPNPAGVAAMVARLNARPLDAHAMAIQLDALVALTSPPAPAPNVTLADMIEGTQNQQAAEAAMTAPVNDIRRRIEHLEAAAPNGFPPQYAHIRDALITYAIQDATWAPNAAAVKGMVQHLRENPLGPTISAQDLDQLVEIAGGAAATQKPTQMAAGTTPEKAILDAAIRQASQTQSRIQHLFKMPPQYADIRDVLVTFALADGQWKPDAEAVKLMSAFLAENPKNKVNLKYLTQLVSAAGDHETAPANREVKKFARHLPVVNNAISTANAAQTRIQFLLTMPPQYAHIRDALIAFALADGQWAPDDNDIQAMNDYIAANPIPVGTELDAAYLTHVIAKANGGNHRPVAVEANVEEVKTADVLAGIASANAVQTRIQHLLTMAPQYAHIRDALVAFAIADGVWAPNADAIKAMSDYLAANPIAGGALNAAYLMKVVAAAGHHGIEPANRATAVVTAPVVDALALADDVQTRIQHLLKMPRQYAYIRDALITFAIQDGAWAPAADDVAAIERHLVAHPLGRDVTVPGLTALVGAANGAGVAPQTTINALLVRAGTAEKAALEVAIAAANATQARISSIKEKINELSAYPAEAHPKLMDLIFRLPADKQQRLLDNDAEKLKRLLAVKSDHDLIVAARKLEFDANSFPVAIAGQKKHVMRGLLDELQSNQQYLRLYNSKIADVLLAQSIVLDPESIREWNRLILNPGLNFVEDLVNAAKTGKKPLEPGQREKLVRVLTLGTAESERPEIDNQQAYNAEIITQLNAVAPPASGQTAVLQVLARIPKTNPLTVPEITALTDAIKGSNDYDTFKSTMEAAAAADAAAPPLGTAVNKLTDWTKVLTPQRFDEIKRRYHHEKLINPKDFKDEIVRQRAEIQRHREALNAFTIADQDTHDELERLTHCNPLVWLNLETEAIARKKAIELFDQFEYLAKVCDDTCRGLEAQKQAYQRLAASLPTDDELSTLGWFRERGQVKAHREAIEADLEKIEEALHRYQLLHFRLHGDPTMADATTKTSALLKKGILGILSEAKELQPAKRQRQPSTYDYQSEDFANEAAMHQKFREYQTSSNKGLTQGLAPTSSLGVLDNTGTLKLGEVRLHYKHGEELPSSTQGRLPPTPKSISASAYKEERGKSSDTSQKSNQQVKMTMLLYPTAKPPLSAQDTLTLKTAQVAFVTEMAANLLARMGQLPTAEHPIVLKGQNEEQVGMLWTALVELGKAHPKFRFNQDAIRIDTVCFDPKKQRGLMGYNSTSYYKKYFEGPSGTPFRVIRDYMTKFYDKGFGTELQQVVEEQTKSDLASFYKKAMNEGREGFKAVGDSAPPGPGGAGP